MKKIIEYLVTIFILCPLILSVKLYHLYLDVKYRNRKHYRNER